MSEDLLDWHVVYDALDRTREVTDHAARAADVLSAAWGEQAGRHVKASVRRDPLPPDWLDALSEAGERVIARTLAPYEKRLAGQWRDKLGREYLRLRDRLTGQLREEILPLARALEQTVTPS